MFIRKDTPTIMDGLVVRYQIEGDVYDGEINASRNGVSLSGRWPIVSVDDSVVIEEHIARARIHAQHLAADRGALFGPRIKALSEADVDRVLAPLPAYET